jgi:hypothetical protein
MSDAENRQVDDHADAHEHDDDNGSGLGRFRQREGSIQLTEAEPDKQQQSNRRHSEQRSVRKTILSNSDVDPCSFSFGMDLEKDGSRADSPMRHQAEGMPLIRGEPPQLRVEQPTVILARLPVDLVEQFAQREGGCEE